MIQRWCRAGMRRWTNTKYVLGYPHVICNKTNHDQQLYHSIQARGENVEDVLREAEAAELATTSQDQDQVDDLMDEDVDPSAEAFETAPVAPGEAPRVRT